ncbi:hypothetical protein PanWU01x14_316980 [Parasponia andersonii]|uniref:Uncharacterized protein n=1 Tax=Parasponia andersonii TaxID=3476 RepID=A0A2P5AMU3_PARAD|nr:hypothetical protein PanWU01x14_316980 [Parasponia andersonii]
MENRFQTCAQTPHKRLANPHNVEEQRTEYSGWGFEKKESYGIGVDFSLGENASHTLALGMRSGTNF